MTEMQLIGALGALLALIVGITTPFTKLTAAINKLVTSVELLKQTVEVFKDLFEKQEDINDDFDMRLDTLSSDLKEFMYECKVIQEKKKYYKDREP